MQARVAQDSTFGSGERDDVDAVATEKAARILACVGDIVNGVVSAKAAFDPPGTVYHEPLFSVAETFQRLRTGAPLPG